MSEIEESTNRVQTSPDGITWTDRVQPLSDGDKAPLFVKIDEDTKRVVQVSPDGITWTDRV